MLFVARLAVTVSQACAAQMNYYSMHHVFTLWACLLGSGAETGNKLNSGSDGKLSTTLSSCLHSLARTTAFLSSIIGHRVQVIESLNSHQFSCRLFV